MSAERQAIERLRSGDETALRWLMEQYGNDIMRTASLLLKDRHLAEDVSQDVFLAAYQKIGQFRSEGSFRSWLLQITINRCRGKMRLASWSRLFMRSWSGGDSDIEDELPWTADRKDLMRDTVPGSEKWAEKLSLRAAIASLPLHYREAIVLYYYQELSIKQLTEVLKEPEGTVKSKLLRGRRLLRLKLEEGGWSDERGAGTIEVMARQTGK
ncbi:RNA polymerase sigma factor [Paenibacillus harenae]|uniref:RNA polymerase sigma-70 factor (ECF subfamily) n=1 Tax=Paenibacillus harenae TaxID=306543 RepID=A0ABT9UAD8_PAEHA|nr:sigma-70 family RNA polymerase sigma factor [Paenibacillus harenae]MDQ0116596.1 RNA polymerase sigma-70 factor (ECF subfamily) [Paenibacillus harenae]